MFHDLDIKKVIGISNHPYEISNTNNYLYVIPHEPSAFTVESTEPLFEES